jgi:hypothetical protein
LATNSCGRNSVHYGLKFSAVKKKTPTLLEDWYVSEQY